MDLDRLLPPSLLAQLPLASPAVQDALARVASDDAAERVTGLDALHATIWRGDRLAEGADEATPFVLAVATAPRWSAATAVLLRLARVLAAVDDPPRSLAGAAGTLASRRFYDRVEVEAPRLVRLASTSRDPARARLAACVVARYPARDAEVEPILIALLSGADDEDERARLLYALTRVQVSQGRPLHRHLAEALAGPDDDPGRFAVLLALSSHAPVDPIRGRCASALREALGSPRSDPRGFGRQLDPGAVQRALEALER